MATRTRLPATTNAGMVEHGGVTRGGNGSLGSNRLVVTADAAQAAASAALAAASQAASAASAAASAASAAASLASANNADISEAAALASQSAAAASAAAAAASEAATAAAVAAEAVIRANADTTLQTNINTEATTRGNADTAINAAIGAEQSSRIAGDALRVLKAGDTMTGDLTIAKTGDAAANIEGSTSAIVRLKDSGSSANNKYTAIIQDAGSTNFRHLNDDLSTKATPMYFGPSGYVVVPGYQFVGEGGGNGQLRFNSGGASTSGWIGWYNSSGNRLGYMGDSNTNMLLALENNAAFSISGGPVQLPAWNTAGRPASPQDGYFGRNTTLGHPEMYMSGKWLPMSSGQVIDASGVAVVDLTIPAGPTIIRIHGGYTYSVANAHKLGFRRSVDNGASYLAGASDYAYNGHYSWGASHASHGAMTFTTYGPISSVDQALGDFYCYFDVMFFVGDGSRQSSWFAHSTGYNSSNSWQGQISGYSFATSTNTRWTNLRLLGSSGHNFTRILATVEYLA